MNVRTTGDPCPECGGTDVVCADCSPLEKDRGFWLEVRSLLLRAVCLIEREKLGETCTTADLRKVGKAQLTKKQT